MSELWKEPTMEITYIELVDLINRSDFYRLSFDLYNDTNKTDSITVCFVSEGKKKYFGFTALRSLSEEEALLAASKATKLIMYEHRTIFDEADNRRAILEECLEMEHVDIKIDSNFFQKLDDGLWEVNCDDDDIVPSTIVYHDLFDFTKSVSLVK